MSQRPGCAVPLTRREVVKGAVAAATFGAGAVLAGRDAAVAAVVPATRGTGSGAGRVAVIGAGAGGVTAAYLLADTLDVEVFEERSKIGGHCDSHVIEYQGQPVTVDLGAQFFHPDTHPIYVTLLAQLGLYDPADPDAGETLQAPASLTILRTSAGAPIFSSAFALSTEQLAIEFASFTQLARKAVLSNLPWRITVDEWVRGLSVSQSFKDEIAYPWITALIGCSRADALQASARSILQTFALEFPADLLQGANTYNSRIGLQGNLQRMLDLSPSVRVHLNTPARSLTRDATGWFVQTPKGRRGPYRFIVLNAPPPAGHRLLRALPGFAAATVLLGAYSYFDSRLVIHTDPAYVASDRRYWASYNAQLTGRQCEGSVWYGALDPPLASGATIDVFKSWAERRPADPTQILLERRYQHPHITRSMIGAARALAPLQGSGGLFFSGVYTAGFDSQESAVYSAMKVAERLAPAGKALVSLKARLAAAGLAGVSYAL
jgi:predicted NAD/FAD-binding protein